MHRDDSSRVGALFRRATPRTRARAVRSGAVVLVTVALLGGTATDGSAQGRGVQRTPDGKRTLVNKDVGTERFAITLNPDGSATGNVFRAGGGDPAFIFCAPLAEANTFACSGADACSDTSGRQRGIQRTPDDQRTLVNKDVGTDRFAITLNEDGTATGNVFRADGSEPAFIFCEPLAEPNTFACSGADRCVTPLCTDQYAFISNVTLPDDFFAVPEPCAEEYTFISNVTLPATFFDPPLPVTFTVNASAPIDALQLQVTYPTAKGSFTGSADGVACSTTASGAQFFANDLDDGTLILIVGSAFDLTFPFDIQCAFEQVGDSRLVAADLAVSVVETINDGQIADPATLTIDVAIP
jgi:hypothetical protein